MKKLQSLPGPRRLPIHLEYLFALLTGASSIGLLLRGEQCSAWEIGVFILTLQPWLFYRGHLPYLYRIGPLRKSQSSHPFMLRARLEKSLVAVLAYTCTPRFIHTDQGPYTARLNAKIVLTLWLQLFAPMLIAALLSGYVQLDFAQLSLQSMCLWSFNMLRVVLDEEIVSRYLIHDYMRYLLPNRPFVATTLSSLAFGIGHYTDGPVMILLSTFAGYFYASAYTQSGSIVNAMALHFLLNLTHLSIASYPSYLRPGKIPRSFSGDKTPVLLDKKPLLALAAAAMTYKAARASSKFLPAESGKKANKGTVLKK